MLAGHVYCDTKQRTTQFKYGNSTLIYGIVIKSVYMPDQDMGKSAINFMVAYNSVEWIY